MYGVTEGNTFELKNGLELKNKVTEIINSRVPF